MAACTTCTTSAYCASKSALVVERLQRRGNASAATSHPVARNQEIGVKPGFGRAALGLPVVTPFHDRRQGHEDGFGAATGLQAEQRSAIIDQVEFDVTAAPVGLEIALDFAERQILAAFDNRHVGVQQVIAYAADQHEAGIEVRLRQVIEEDAANAARLPAMFEIEILVAPFLELAVGFRSERFQGLATGAVKVHGIFLEAVVRRQ